MTHIPYCRRCFGVGPQCRCVVAPRRATGPATALWTPPIASYAAMASATETTASTSAGVAPPLGYPDLPMPQLEPMETSPPLPTGELLLMAGVGRGGQGRTPPQTPTTPGLCQTRPRTPQLQVPTPGGQGATAQTPYQQQVIPPPTPAPQSRATPSASQSQGRERPTARETERRGRSSSGGPHNRQRATRSTTRGSRKRRRRAPDDDLMVAMGNYVASGWKRDLTHIVGCCWEAQEGPLHEDWWKAAIEQFLAVMARKKSEWSEIKELTPLRFMPYVAKLFREVTGKGLWGLDQFTGWVGRGGYYHWRLVQLGQVHLVPHLQGEPMPRTPGVRPSGWPLPPAPSSTSTTTAGVSDASQGGGPQPASTQRWEAPPSQGGGATTSSQGGGATASSRGGRSSTPHQGPTPAASRTPANPPPSSQGRGDGSGVSWYQLALREAESRVSEPRGPPFPVASAQVRQEAVGQLYGWVDGKDPPPNNVLSRALWAYYSRVDLSTLKTWACQALCMIAEYHLACVMRGPVVTSPLLPAVIEERLPLMNDYAPPVDHTGVTDVRVRDNWAWTLHVAEWCHRLDMSIWDPQSSHSLVRSHHQQGDISGYFLGPGTAWSLTFEDVIDQVLKENIRHLGLR